MTGVMYRNELLKNNRVILHENYAPTFIYDGEQSAVLHPGHYMDPIAQSKPPGELVRPHQ